MTVLDLAAGQRQASFRYELLDKALEFVADLVVLSDTTPSIDNDTDRAVKRQLSSMTLDPRQLGDINPLEHRVRVHMVTSEGDYPLGVFLFSSYDRKRSSRGTFPMPTLSDQCVILDQPSDTTLSIAPGTLITDALTARINAFGVPFVVAMEASSARVSPSTPMTWPGGTSRLQIINELAAVAGFYSVHFDNSGQLVLRRPVEAIDPLDADLEYRLDASSRVIAESIVVSDSLIDAPNRYVVRDTSATDAPVVGVYNVPAEAPHSAANRGYVVSVNLDRQGIGTTAQAQAAARAAALAGQVFEWLGFASAPDPRHDTFQTVAFDGVVYRETGWTMPLRDGAPMTHELRRTYE